MHCLSQARQKSWKQSMADVEVLVLSGRWKTSSRDVVEFEDVVAFCCRGIVSRGGYADVDK